MIQPAADEVLALWRELIDRLGDRFYAGNGGVGFEWTAKGRPAVRVGDTTYFADAGQIVAAVTRGGRAEFSRILEDGGREPVGATGLGDPSEN